MRDYLQYATQLKLFIPFSTLYANKLLLFSSKFRWTLFSFLLPDISSDCDIPSGMRLNDNERISDIYRFDNRPVTSWFCSQLRNAFKRFNYRSWIFASKYKIPNQKKKLWKHQNDVKMTPKWSLKIFSINHNLF